VKAQIHPNGNGRQPAAAQRPTAAATVEALYRAAAEAHDLLRLSCVREAEECRHLERLAREVGESLHRLGLSTLRHQKRHGERPAREGAIDRHYLGRRFHALARRAARLGAQVAGLDLEAGELARLTALLAQVDEKLTGAELCVEDVPAVR
jgi:hypothetical protein